MINMRKIMRRLNNENKEIDYFEYNDKKDKK